MVNNRTHAYCQYLCLHRKVPFTTLHVFPSPLFVCVFSTQYSDSLLSLWSLLTAPPQRDGGGSDKEVEIWCQWRWEKDGGGERRKWRRERLIMQFKIMLALKKEEREQEEDKERGSQHRWIFFVYSFTCTFHVFFHFALFLSLALHRCFSLLWSYFYLWLSVWLPVKMSSYIL